ncbi:ankyrin repeat domain-containing protein [Quisquiliibacterium transsilvanicum]|uniref:Ankyrin repeat protein n=1 Tax=Quisquiliibacterium transsilvanicum TaxID=1549638 RepID=A0A7W8M9V9_9BURK|nr:ankyrin repeat domain-containing protein [Quisquiliibacterium transsilvanicum]MBB5273298.1 ankyrin repeat protein [Quisquiliibacterium transsilvanicum]
MWTFPALIQPSVFVAAPGDLAYLREAVARELEDLQRKVADDHGIRLYDWQVDKAEDGFRDWVPPQGQIPLPSDSQCRAVICMLGERIGTPLAADFDTRPLGPIQSLRGDGVGLVHPWEPGAEDAGGFALTGTVFEYLAALHANRERGHDEGGAERGQPPVLLLVVGDETVREDLDPLDANWGGHRLFEAAERRFRDSHGARWRTASREWEQTQYVPQVTQLRNFVRYLEGRGIFPRIVADEEQARAELRAFLMRELDLRVREQARNPFKGLQAFDREDNGVFVGREAERTQAVAELTALWNDAAHPTFYGVIGGSGVGKSSLARAGIVGHLCHQTSQGSYLGCIVRPDELLPDPLPRLYAFALAQVQVQQADDAAGAALAFEKARASLTAVRDEMAAGEAVQRLAGALAGRGAQWRLILAFDQFEELLDRRADTGGAAAWEPVVDFIARAAAHPAMGVVYTLQTNRAELIAQDPKLGPLWARGGNLRLAFPEHSLDDIIRKPFEFAGVAELEPGLVRVLRERIVRFAHQSDGESTGSLLPLVSLTLQRIFEASKRIAADARTGTGTGGTAGGTADGADRGASGGVADALAGANSPQRLAVEDCQGLLDVEDAIAELAEAAVQEARAAAGADWTDDAIGSLLRRLVRLSGAANDRLVLPDAPMPTRSAPRRLAAALAARRLLLPEAGGRIKLVHEAVLRHWPAASAWLDGQRRLLRLHGIVGFKADEWEAGGRADASLDAHGARDVDEAAELLAQWFDVFGGRAAGEDSDPSPADRRLRDYGLALLRAHPAPRRPVERSTSGSTHLHLAATYGDLPTVRALLAADPSAVDVERRDRRTPLFGPCFGGDLPVIAALVEAGADVDHAEADGWRPLHIAASAGQVAAIDALLAVGASLPLASDGSVTPPLYLAASNAHLAAVERLLDLGADPAQAAGGWTPLHAAAAEGHAEVARRLAQRGAPADARLPESGYTPLHVATLNGREDAVRALCAAGAAPDASVDYEQRKECTALHLAVLKDLPGCARALVETGANPNPQDDLGRTPLQLALSTGRIACAEALLQAGADPDAPARDGHTCLDLAVADGDEARVRFLLAHGARADARNPGGRTALQRAAAEGREGLLRQLLDAGADPRLSDDDGCIALHHAARRGQLPVLELLLTLPAADADARNADGLGPLHLAAAAGHTAAVGYLLAHHAAPDPRDADGWTPLHLAALGGHADTARALLGAGAAPDPLSDLPETRPLIVAAELGHAELARVLIGAGAAIEGGTAHKPAPLEAALRFRQLNTARALLRAGARVDPQEAAWVARLLAGDASCAPSDGDTVPSSPLRGIFNAGGPTAAGGAGWSASATGAQDAIDAAQARLLTATAGVLQYRWRPAPAQVRVLVAAEPGLAAAGLRCTAPDTKVEITGLAWYERASLVRISDPGWPNPALTVYFVLSSAGTLVRLAGVSPPLHELAASEPLRLSPENVLGYLKFFCFFVRGNEGAFYILEQADDPMVPPDVDESLRRLLRDTVRPAFLDGLDEQGRHVCDAVVWYSNALFIARFGIASNGMMEMLSDEPIAADLPIRAEAPIA